MSSSRWQRPWWWPWCCRIYECRFRCVPTNQWNWKWHQMKRKTRQRISLLTFGIAALSFPCGRRTDQALCPFPNQSIMFCFDSVRLKEVCIIFHNNNFHKYWHLPFADCPIALSLPFSARRASQTHRLTHHCVYGIRCDFMEQQEPEMGERKYLLIIKKQQRGIGIRLIVAEKTTNVCCPLSSSFFFSIYSFGVRDGVHPDVRDHTNFVRLSARLPLSDDNNIISVFVGFFFHQRKKKYFPFSFVFNLLSHFGADARTHFRFFSIYMTFAHESNVIWIVVRKITIFFLFQLIARKLQSTKQNTSKMNRIQTAAAAAVAAELVSVAKPNV